MDCCTATLPATVVIATGIMGLAQLYLLRVTGPAVAVGVACLLLAGVSLLPALMALCGKALFWPAQPRPGTLTVDTVPEKGFWARAGRFVTAHPRVIALISIVLLLPLAVSAVLIEPSFDDLRSLPATAPAVQAFNAYSAHFKDASQAKVIINYPAHDLRQPQYSAGLAQVATALSHVQHITQVQAPSTASQTASPQQFFATDGSAAAITFYLNVDPTPQEARQASRARRRRQALVLEALEERITLSLTPQMVLDINPGSASSYTSGTVATGFRVVPSITVTSPDFSLLTHTQNGRAAGG